MSDDSKVVAATNKRKPPNAGKGRPAGSLNKTTATLKESILQAAQAVGIDGKGTEGLTGYLKRVANEDQKAFCSLLGKVLPMTIAGDPSNPLQARVTVEFVGKDS